MTAILAATYLVVGAAGDGLFYLIEAPAVGQAGDGQQAGSQTGEAYLHDHGDGRWHHHGTHRPKSVAPGGGRADGALAGTNPGKPVWRLRSGNPHDHTTLLLALASEIELSVVADLPASDAPRVGRTVGAKDRGRVLRSNVASLGPRGPPTTGMA